MNLYLIGYRGSGKSSVAPLLARELNRELVDTDDLIENQTGASISQIFSQHGEPEFRRIETEIICSISSCENRVVSLGGGAPLAEQNRVWLKSNGRTIWLTAPPNVLWERISGDATSTQRRPDLTDDGGRLEVERVLATRIPIYSECADYTIDVREMSPEQIADNIARWWESVDNQ
jgi:shikimate kinase